jgi:hypothetical protein
LKSFHCEIDCRLQRFGLFQREPAKSYRIAGFQLSQFPTLSLHDHGGTNEPTQARTVRTKQNRHIAGEVDGADGIRVVVDIRRMESRFTSILARPLRLGSYEPYAGAVRLIVDLPVSAEKHLDIVGGEELGRCVRAIKDSNLPMAIIGGS